MKFAAKAWLARVAPLLVWAAVAPAGAQTSPGGLALDEGVGLGAGVSLRGPQLSAVASGAVVGTGPWGRAWVQVGTNWSGGQPDVDGFSFSLFRLAHFHLLSLERNTQAAMGLGVEIVAAYLPVRVGPGDANSTAWQILRVGGALDYRWLLRSLGARTDSHSAVPVLVARLDQGVELSPRWSLRAFEELAYAAYLGFSQDAARREWIPSAGHVLSARGGARLEVDVSPEGGTRRIARENPRTGEREERLAPGRGPRLHVVVLDLNGEIRLVDTMTQIPAALTATSGVLYRY